jgi:hypothetical protein
LEEIRCNFLEGAIAEGPNEYRLCIIDDERNIYQLSFGKEVSDLVNRLFEITT